MMTDDDDDDNNEAFYVNSNMTNEQSRHK